MAIRVCPYVSNHEAAVREFNDRVRASAGAFDFPQTAAPDWLPAGPGRHLFQEQYLALEDSEVRGGYVLKHQNFAFRGVPAAIACCHSMLSEGIAEEKYRGVGARLLSDALARQPLLYTFEKSAALHAAPPPGWNLSSVPAYFHIVHPAAFLLHAKTLRTSPARRFLLSLAAFTGFGSLALRLYLRVKAKPRAVPAAAVDFFDEFGSWADDLWTQCAPRYPFLAERDSATLGTLYPGGKFLRIKISSARKTIGWAVALDTQMQWNREYGDMRLGSIVDALSLEEHAPLVIATARRLLERRGVDLIVCNHAHPAWQSALRSAGFLEGAPEFVFGTSPALTRKLEETGAAGALFLTRAEGNMRALPEFDHALV